jgi:hypothetical protein
MIKLLSVLFSISEYFKKIPKKNLTTRWKKAMATTK